MNKALLFLLSPLAVVAQQNLSIRGRMPELAAHDMYLEGKNHFKKAISFDKQGNFLLNTQLDSGYYSIDKDFYFYLGSGMNLSIEGKLDQLKFQGRGNAENLTFNQINQLSQKYFPLEGSHLHHQFNDMDPDTFLDIASKFFTEADSLLNKHSFGSHFLQSQQDHIKYLVKYFTYSYLQRYGIAPEKEAEYFKIAENLRPGAEISEVLPALKAMQVKRLPAERFTQLQAMVWEDFDINNSVLYSFSEHYRKLVFTRIESLRTAELIKSPYLRSKNPNEIRKDIIRKEFADGAIKDELLYQNMLSLLCGGTDDERFFNEYKAISRDSVYLADIRKKYEVLQRVTPGSEAPQFAFKDPNNKTVSLSSLKGNYVFVNIWATWLNSSLQEIPYLKNLEKKYQNQNIKFVNISVDSPLLKDKWARYTKEQYPEGLHVIADKELRSDFVKAFSINTFPRFIIIDPEGKMVSANAPRPSSIRLQDTLDKLLFNNLSTCVNCSKKEQ